MAEIVDGGGGGGKHGKKTAKKGSARIDMTPMVDLAFLLLTFFVLAATLAKPKAMEIIYPKEAKNDDIKTKLNKDLATTILLGEKENEVYYYKGFFKPDSTVACTLSGRRDSVDHRGDGGLGRGAMPSPSLNDNEHDIASSPPETPSAGSENCNGGELMLFDMEL